MISTTFAKTAEVIGVYQPNQGNEDFNLAYLKLLTDGSAQGLTAYQYTPYACDGNYKKFSIENAALLPNQKNTGLFNYGYPLEFNALVQMANSYGWPTMIHANGDQAIDRTISAFRAAGISNSTKDLRRDRIEHCSLLTTKNMQDMADLGISPSFTIGHVGFWGWGFQKTIIGEQRANQLDLCRSTIVDYNMRITFNSDYSVTPLGPLRLMEQSITRLMEDTPKDQRQQVLHSAECITPFQALKAMTYDAAWQCHADQWVGSLEVGKCADFVILAESPLTYQNQANLAHPSQGMRNIPVLETWKGGKNVYTLKTLNPATTTLSHVRFDESSNTIFFNYLGPNTVGEDKDGSPFPGEIWFKITDKTGKSKVDTSAVPLAKMMAPLAQVCQSYQLPEKVLLKTGDTLVAGPYLSSNDVDTIAATAEIQLNKTTRSGEQSTYITSALITSDNARVTFQLPELTTLKSGTSWLVIIDPSINADGEPIESTVGPIFGWSSALANPDGKNVIFYKKLTETDAEPEKKGLFTVSDFTICNSPKDAVTYRVGICLGSNYRLSAYQDLVFVSEPKTSLQGDNTVNATAAKDLTVKPNIAQEAQVLTTEEV